ncbi:hypothetical protein D3C79_693770 [compost metagenome]
MIDSVDVPGAHDVQKLGLVAHRAQDGYQADRKGFTGNALLQLGEDAVEVEFTVIEKQQVLGRLPQNLPAKL